MKKMLCTGLIGLMLTVLLSGCGGEPASVLQKGDILISSAGETSYEQVEALAQELGGEIVDSMPQMRLYWLRFQGAEDEDVMNEMIGTLSEYPQWVESAEAAQEFASGS